MRALLFALFIALPLSPALSEQLVSGYVNGKLDGDVRIDGYLDLTGIVTGDLIAPAETQLTCSGIVIGNVIVGEGASIKINGTINGEVANFGGDVEISGIVGAIRNYAENARTIAFRGSYVRGNKIEADTSNF